MLYSLAKTIVDRKHARSAKQLAREAVAYAETANELINLQARVSDLEAALYRSGRREMEA